MAKQRTNKKKCIRYELKSIIYVETDDFDAIENVREVIESAQQYGTCEIVDTSIVERDEHDPYNDPTKD